MRDITLGDTIDFKFNTCEPDTGAPATLSGTPVISAYVGNSTTQITAGITLTADFDGVTGLNNVRVVASSGNGYTTASDVALIITTGTVDAVSAVGYKVAEFTIGRGESLALRPTTAGRTLDVAATGEAGMDMDNILLTNGAPKAGIHASGTLSGTHSATTADLGTNAPGAGLIVVGMTLYFPAHALSVLVTAYNDSTGVATFEAITPTLANGNVWFLYPTAASTGGGAGLDAAGVRAAVGLASANLDTQLDAIDNFLDTEVAAIKVKTDFLPSATAGSAGGVFIAGTNAATTITTALTANQVGNITGNLSGSVGSVTGAVASVTGAVGSVTGAVGSVTGNVGGNVTGSVGSVTGNVGGNVVGTVASVAGAVGSVAGNVGGNVVGSVASVASNVNANIVRVNGVLVQGAGTEPDPWGPA